MRTSYSKMPRSWPALARKRADPTTVTKLPHTAFLARWWEVNCVTRAARSDAADCHGCGTKYLVAPDVQRIAREARDTRERIRSEAHRDRNFTPQRNGFELDGHSIIALFEPSDAILLEFSVRQQSRLAALQPFANWNWG